MKVRDAIKIAKWRFNRGWWIGNPAIGRRADRRGWRKVIRNVQMLCEKRGLTIEDFPL